MCLRQIQKERAPLIRVYGQAIILLINESHSHFSFHRLPPAKLYGAARMLSYPFSITGLSTIQLWLFNISRSRNNHSIPKQINVHLNQTDKKEKEKLPSILSDVT